MGNHRNDEQELPAFDTTLVESSAIPTNSPAVRTPDQLPTSADTSVLVNSAIDLPPPIYGRELHLFTPQHIATLESTSLTNPSQQNSSPAGTSSNIIATEFFTKHQKLVIVSCEGRLEFFETGAIQPRNFTPRAHIAHECWRSLELGTTIHSAKLVRSPPWQSAGTDQNCEEILFVISPDMIHLISHEATVLHIYRLPERSFGATDAVIFRNILIIAFQGGFIEAYEYPPASVVSENVMEPMWRLTSENFTPIQGLARLGPSFVVLSMDPRHQNVSPLEVIDMRLLYDEEDKKPIEEGGSAEYWAWPFESKQGNNVSETTIESQGKIIDESTTEDSSLPPKSNKSTKIDDFYVWSYPGREWNEPADRAPKLFELENGKCGILTNNVSRGKKGCFGILRTTVEGKYWEYARESRIQLEFGAMSLRSLPFQSKDHYVLCLPAGTIYLIPKHDGDNQNMDGRSSPVYTTCYPHDLEKDYEFCMLQDFTAGILEGGIPVVFFLWPGGIVEVYSLELIPIVHDAIVKDAIDFLQEFKDYNPKAWEEIEGRDISFLSLDACPNFRQFVFQLCGASEAS